MRRALAGLLVVACGAGAGVACGDDDGSLFVDLDGDSTSTSAAPDDPAHGGDVPHALAEIDGWVLTEHADPEPGEGPALPGPFEALDWYSAYERSHADGGTTSVERVAVQGLAAEADRLADRFAGQRYAAGPEVAGRPTLVGEPVADTEPVIVLVDVGGATIVLMSYELDRAEVLAWADALRFVSEEEWAAVRSEP